MNKIFFGGDFHLSSSNHGSRLDDTVEEGLRKLQFLLEQASAEKAVLVFTGDFLHNNANSKQYLMRIRELVDSYNVPVYTIGGNHECRGTSFSSYKNSDIQLLFLPGKFEYLDSSEQDLVLPNGFLIRGYSAYSELSVKDSEKVIGLVVHHFLIDSFEDTLICYPNKMKQLFPNLQFIVAGHDHSYYPITQDAFGVYIIRPGSLLRISSESANNRKPCYAAMDLNESGLDYVEYREVPAKKYSEVFQLDVKKEEKQQVKAVDNFITSITAEKSTSVDVADVLKHQLGLVQDDEQRSLIREDLINYSFIER